MRPKEIDRRRCEDYIIDHPISEHVPSGEWGSSIIEALWGPLQCFKELRYMPVSCVRHLNWFYVEVYNMFLLNFGI